MEKDGYEVWGKRSGKEVVDVWRSAIFDESLTVCASYVSSAEC